MARARRQTNEKKTFSLRERLGGIEDPSKDLVATAKSYFVGEESGNQSNAIVEQDRNASIFNTSGCISPIYDPLVLALIYENSSSLRQNVDAYVTNIDSFGSHFIPVLDLTADEVDEKIRDAIRAERRYDQKSSGDAKASEEPSDEDVKDRKAELQIAMRSELSDLEAFFANCSPNMPFAGPEGLRGLTRQDIEVFGYAYWEVLRNGMGEVSQFNKLESRSMRMMPIDDGATDTTILRRVSSLKTVKVAAKKRFRNYIQRYEGSSKFVYYKEFGDPRVTSAQTGKHYADVKELQTKEKDAAVATEIIAFKISSVRSVYGVPRWVGAMLAVLGTRQSEEVNFLYFENRSIPPMAIIVSGGRLNKDAVKKLEDHIANQIRGKRNFHKILIIEGEASTSADGTGPNNGKMKIELKPLTDSQQKDALFQEYDERNADKVGQTFRLPRLLRGDVRDFNRSTAEASIDFAEIQVFGPIRQQFDWMINTLILPELGVQYWSFKSNAPTVRDPEALATMIKDLVTASVLTPEEARALARGVFNEELPNIKEEWTKQPIAITLANANVKAKEEGMGDFNDAGGMSAGGAGATQAALGVDQSKSLVASALLKIEKYMLSAERQEWKEQRKNAEKIKVPADLFDSCFTPNG